MNSYLTKVWTQSFSCWCIKIFAIWHARIFACRRRLFRPVDDPATMGNSETLWMHLYAIASRRHQMSIAIMNIKFFYAKWR